MRQPEGLQERPGLRDAGLDARGARQRVRERGAGAARKRRGAVLTCGAGRARDVAGRRLNRAAGARDAVVRQAGARGRKARRAQTHARVCGAGNRHGVGRTGQAQLRQAAGTVEVGLAQLAHVGVVRVAVIPGVAHAVLQVVGARRRGGVRRALILPVDEAKRVRLADRTLVVRELVRRHTHQRAYKDCPGQQSHAATLFNTHASLLI